MTSWPARRAAADRTIALGLIAASLPETQKYFLLVGKTANLYWMSIDFYFRVELDFEGFLYVLKSDNFASHQIVNMREGIFATYDDPAFLEIDSHGSYQE